MSRAERETPLDPYRDLFGLDLSEERLASDLWAYADILQAIRKLRELDLTDVHPAVVFDPCVGRSNKDDE